MIKKLILGLMALGFVGTASAADVYAGTWNLNVSKSTFAPGMEVRAMSAVVTEEGADLAVSGTSIDGAGEATSVKYMFPMNGGTLSYTEGAPESGAIVMAKRVNASTIDSSATLDGKEVGSTHATVSADGEMLTRVVKGTDANGKAYTNTEVYDRQ